MDKKFVDNIKKDKLKVLHQRLCINKNPDKIAEILKYHKIQSYREAILSWSCCQICMYITHNMKSYQVQIHNENGEIYLVLLEKNSKRSHEYHTIDRLNNFEGINAWNELAIWIKDRNNKNRKRINSEDS